MNAWWKRVRDELGRKGWSVVEFERRTGIDKGRLYKYVTGEVSQPRGDAFRRMADALGVNEWWLRTGEGARTCRLPIIGKVSGSDHWNLIGTEAERRFVDFELGEEDCIALEVLGPAMAPAYRDGDVVVCLRKSMTDYQQSSIAGVLRRDCAVQTVEGLGYLKSVFPGTQDGKFTLRSINPDFTDIENVRLAWIAPVLWIRRKV